MKNLFIILFSLNLLISQASNGVVLLSDYEYDIAVLVDIDNEIVNQWEIPNLIKSYLNPDSTLYSFSRVDNNDFLIQLIDWDGNHLWTYLLENDVCSLHHEQEILPNGNILCLCRETIPDGLNVFFDNDLEIDKIIEIEPIGNNEANIIWEWHFYNHLIQDSDADSPEYGDISQNPQLLDINITTNYSDYTHINCIDFNPELNQIIMSSRSLNEIYIIDHSTTTSEAIGHSGGIYNMGGDILYRWGNPLNYNRGDVSDKKLFSPHGVNWIENNFPGEGNILLFNNNHSEGSSAVIEFNPPVLSNGFYSLINDGPHGPHDYIWVYQSDFHSQTHSGAFRQANGNTFITSFQDNRILEVDYGGMIQWEYNGNFVNVHRAIKYAESYFNSSILGDINQDGDIDILDVVLLLNMILGDIPIDFSADLNLDNLVDILDIVKLINIILF